ncbi:MAG: hypothetical protein FVQ84_05805 [Planctomycetes bacterium]|nr:hypothetical protein [Planctomycetota bacterium]
MAKFSNPLPFFTLSGDEWVVRAVRESPIYDLRIVRYIWIFLAILRRMACPTNYSAFLPAVRTNLFTPLLRACVIV